MGNYLGIDIGGTAIKWALLTEDYEVLERGDFPTSSVSSAEGMVESLVSVAEPFKGQFQAVGASVPGTIYEDDPTGTVHKGGSLPYMDGCPLGQELSERLGVPAAVENDGKGCVLGEYAAGALKGIKNGVVLVVGTGIGGGILIDGNVLRGVHGFAGEFSILMNDVEAPFSAANIFAESCSWRGLRAAVLKAKGLQDDPAYQDIDGRALFEWIDAGDEGALAGLAAYAKPFAGMIINLQTTLDPEAFVIAGGISGHDSLVQAIRDAVHERLAELPPGMIPEPRVERAQLGNDANFIGAILKVRRMMGEEA